MRAIIQKVILLLICLVALLTLSPPSMRVWRYTDEAFEPVTDSGHLLPVPDPEEADLDQDGEMECLRLLDGQAVLFHHPCSTPAEEQEIAWVSPDGWRVIGKHLSDLNDDQMVEISLLVWREFQPWFIDQYIPYPGRINNFHNDQNQSCHVILIGWRNGKYKELWAGSAMADPLLSFFPADVDGDADIDLVALESHYAYSLDHPAYALTAWEWNGFGFTLLAREKGSFHSMQVVRSEDDNIFILTGW